jgi:predicted ATPase
MRLSKAHVRNFKSIASSGDVAIDPAVTVLVGQNESGKTGFLRALEKARPIEGGDAKFHPTEDFPRTRLNDYEKQHQSKPAKVVDLTFELTSEEVERINTTFGAIVVQNADCSMTLHYDYKGACTVTELPVSEDIYVRHVVAGATLHQAAVDSVAQCETVDALISTLSARDEPDAVALAERLGKELPENDDWGRLSWKIYSEHLEPHTPRFFYFDDYNLLPGKVSLSRLHDRFLNVTQDLPAKPPARPAAIPKNPDALEAEDLAVLALLRMANIQLEELLSGALGYEDAKAKLEAFGNSVSDKLFQYWKQNPDLDVEFDVKADPKDRDYFATGLNLYIRIRNKRHRVTLPFNQRSKGFIWFFSFIAWFEDVKQQLGTDDALVLLLDEPGLSLHAMAQSDFLNYIDHLSEKNQVIYTTHSPFMIRNDRLHQVRVVEDRKDVGTIVTEQLQGSDRKTLFPLQGALGYDLAQNLFIAERNLVVEGPADLIYLQFVSSMLVAAGRTGLRDDAVIVPAGGLDKVATFIALLQGNSLQTVVLHDMAQKPDARLESMIQQKIIAERLVLNYAMFRTVPPTRPKPGDTALPPTDVEDLFTVDEYLSLFNGSYQKGLGDATVAVASLPAGYRVIERLDRYLAASTVVLRPSGGFNHYFPANYLALHPIALDASSLDRFEGLFKAVNGLFS